MNSNDVTQMMCRGSLLRGVAEKIEEPDECGLCGKTEPEVRLEDFYGEKYCEGYCLKQVQENARINERDKVLEERRLGRYE